ncbi:RNA-binding protein Jag [hydrothermal vent metagenome]|uniref:RNA-binding protein Jag n=1 Tax=hydrothermal vent metagenome TaxID=652676 RepID=A0A1W1CTU5_9ZZZZ
MLKIEASTLEIAYQNAASKLECSITQLKIEVVQVPSKGFLGFFKKRAIIVAIRLEEKELDSKPNKETKAEIKQEKKSTKETSVSPKKSESKKAKKVQKEKSVKNHKKQTVLNDTIMPASFVSDQDDEEDDDLNGLDFTADYDDEYDERSDEEEVQTSTNLDSIVEEVQTKINGLFKLTCFAIDSIEVSAYDCETLLIEFKGDDAALLIGKEGYRYKALSYMIFNWINSKYEVQLRLEIAEFLKNQEESIGRYLINVCENIDRDGRAQTKILDGVLVQIALKELRERYPQKYVVIRSTRDGLKYIIINDYNN